MNQTFVIAIGIVLTILTSLVGLVLVPNWQFEEMQPVEVTLADGSTTLYPQPPEPWQVAPGREVYRGLGCMYCHTQQVYSKNFGADLERGWGTRRSVPRDYIHQDPPLMGTMRTGPDLASIGMRQPSEQWHYLHLYDPKITSPGSTMPPFRFLFDVYHNEPPHPVLDGTAYEIPSEDGGRRTWIVPRREAVQLVQYLLSLKQEHLQEVVQ